MKRRIVRLENLKEFCEQANLVNGDVILKRGKRCLDAKSFMGVWTVIVSGDNVTVEFPEDAIEFEEYLNNL